MSKNSSDSQISLVLLNGGSLCVEGCRVFIDNPENYDEVGVPTGYWIMNAQGWKTYFKCSEREKAQKACNTLFGSGAYKVNSKD